MPTGWMVLLPSLRHSMEIGTGSQQRRASPDALFISQGEAPVKGRPRSGNAPRLPLNFCMGVPGTQEVILGIDMGSKHVKIGASMGNCEFFVAEILPRNNVSKNVATRRVFCRARRNQQTRFLNRVYSKYKGWLPLP
ncbi:RRXRR domain-containing protein [Enterocloster clostridioformis]|nr:RRXRR domain-containing protein [Enterocloster clostridioformis]NDO27826.1 hypothetical protein [Enterocloster clostridioformis]QQR00432.1 RRXRR domain-containing protein [Enterocloster clostridioformis]